MKLIPISKKIVFSWTVSFNLKEDFLNKRYIQRYLFHDMYRVVSSLGSLGWGSSYLLDSSVFQPLSALLRLLQARCFTHALVSV